MRPFSGTLRFAGTLPVLLITTTLAVFNAPAASAPAQVLSSEEPLYVDREPSIEPVNTAVQDSSEQTTNVPAQPVEPLAVPVARPTRAAGLYAGGTGKKIATIEFWMELAYCETHQDWDNPGTWSGGLGIYNGTWYQWGGREFARTAETASVSEQIIVANRISTQGWRRPDGSFQEPVWFTGWGALPCVGKPRLVPLDSPSAYLPEQYAAAGVL
jgi:hypothetical protein